MLKPVFAGLAISSLCLAFAVDLQAQNATKSATKKKAAVQPVQAGEDDPEPAPASPRARRPAADTGDDADGAEGAAARGTQGSRGGTPARPPALDPVRLETLSPELEKILKDWELVTSQFKTMAGEFSRFKYDITFEVEKRAEGKFTYEAPDKGYYHLWGTKIDSDAVSQKLGKDGKTPFELKSDDPDHWVCNGKKVIKIDDKAKKFEEVAIPPENQGQNIIDGPLPFLFGMKAEKAKLRYKLSLKKSDGKEIWLGVIPRWRDDAANWTKATVIIEAKTFKPRAVKLLDPTGSESVHVFRNVVINERKGFFDKDPFKPNLWGYKAVLPPDKSKSASKNKNSSTGVDDVPDLGRTADSGADNTARKKAAAKTK
jgi:TIGR03009 family protein